MVGYVPEMKTINKPHLKDLDFKRRKKILTFAESGHAEKCKYLTKLQLFALHLR